MQTKALLTAVEFLQTGPETDHCELVRGEVVPMPPPAKGHGAVCANVVYRLTAYTKQIGHGSTMCNDTGIMTQHDPDTVRGADVMLFLHPSWEGQSIPEGYSDEPADLVVEVRSPSQSWTDVVKKVGEYLAIGCRLVWVIDPHRKRVTVFSPEQEPATFAPENDLDGGGVLPGFRCRVSELLDG